MIHIDVKYLFHPVQQIPGTVLFACFLLMLYRFFHDRPIDIKEAFDCCADIDDKVGSVCSILITHNTFLVLMYHYFESMFYALKEKLSEWNVKIILVAQWIGSLP